MRDTRVLAGFTEEVLTVDQLEGRPQSVLKAQSKSLKFSVGKFGHNSNNLLPTEAPVSPKHFLIPSQVARRARMLRLTVARSAALDCAFSLVLLCRKSGESLFFANIFEESAFFSEPRHAQ